MSVPSAQTTKSILWNRLVSVVRASRIVGHCSIRCSRASTFSMPCASCAYCYGNLNVPVGVFHNFYTCLMTCLLYRAPSPRGDVTKSAFGQQRLKEKSRSERHPPARPTWLQQSQPPPPSLQQQPRQSSSWQPLKEPLHPGHTTGQCSWR